MKGDMTLEEWIAKQCEDPEFARYWAEDEPRVFLAVNVYRLRDALGWTQQQLAARAGVKQPRIAEIERTEANPTLLTLTRLAIALGVPVDRLLASTRRKDEEEPATAKPMKMAPPRRVRRRAKA